jgi:LPS export ABC transporter protein LptC
MNSRFVPLPVLRSAALLAGGALLWGIWRWTEEPPASKEKDAPPPAVIFENLRSLKIRDKGQLVWELSAKRITADNERGVALAEGVERAVYYRNGQPFMTIKAQRVKLKQLTRDIEADGHVSASGANGFSATTTRALWSHQKQELHCTAPVRAKLRGHQFAAPELRYDAKNGVLRCPKPSRATLGQVQVQAATLSFDTKSETLRCPQSVKAQTPRFTIVSNGVIFENKSGILRCPQAVIVQSSGATLRGGSAIVDTKKRRVKLSRGVEIVASPGAAPNLEQLPELANLGATLQ